MLGRNCFIRGHYSEPLTLATIAREAGSSSFHFARLFLAYTGETPFEFLRRIRLSLSLRRLRDDPTEPVTAIALSVGYETSSAFNKVFKKVLEMNPGDFRKLGQERQKQLIYDFSKPKMPTDSVVNLTTTFEMITRPLTHYVYLEKSGPFVEVAPSTWNEIFPLLRAHVNQTSIIGYLGLSTIDTARAGEEAMIYQAGVALSSTPERALQRLKYKDIEGGSYARFLLTGPYSQVWIAFDQIFKKLAEKQVELRNDFCIENYLNDPAVTPEDELLTELLVPAV